MEVLNCLSDDGVPIEKRLRLAKNCLAVTTGLLTIGNQPIFDWLVDELVTTDEGTSVKDSVARILSKFLLDEKAEEISLNLILKPSHLKLLARQIQESDCEKELQTYIIFLDSCLDHLSLLRCIVKDERILLDLTSSVLRQCSFLSSFGNYFKLLGRLGFQLQEKNRLLPSLQLLQVFMSAVFPRAISFLVSTPVAENATEAKVRWSVVVQNFIFGNQLYEDWKKFLHSIPEKKEEIPHYPDTLKAIIVACKEQMSQNEKCPLIVRLLVEGFLRRYKKSQTEAFIFMALLLAILGIYPEAKDQPAIITKTSRDSTSLSVQATSKPETQVEAVLDMLSILKEKEYNLMTDLNGLSFMSWLQNLVQYLIKEFGKTVPKVMKVCEVLMNINPVSIQYVPGPIIKSVLSSRTDITNHDCDSLLSAILTAFVKLRDVSKFVQLLLQASNLLKLGSDFVGRPFLESLENVVTLELISAQTIKLWELILQGIENDFKSDFVSQPSCLILGSILLSGKLVDHTLPEVQFEEISCLSTRTQEMIKQIFEKKDLDKNDQNGVLKLAVSYNELHSNLMRYVAVYRQGQNEERMDEDSDSIPGLVAPPKKFKKRVDASLLSEIHLQFFKLHGREEFTPEDFDHLHKIEPNSAQFALYCKSSSPEASIKLASLLMIPSHSSLLNVYDVVDNRRIQLGLLLNLIDENIDGWSSFTKVVKENHGIFYSNNNRMQEDSLKKITAIVEKVFLERSIEENMEVNFMLQKLEILGHFPIHSFRRVEKILLVCYLIAILSSTNQADISEKACCLLVCALDSGDKTYPILTYFDPNSVLPWLIRKGKILDNPKVLKAVFEVFTEIAAKSLGNMENFSGFSKEESTDLSQMAGALFLENLRKGQKRLKKSPNKATADKILKSIIKSFQKSLKAPPQLFVDMGNSTKNCTLLSICSSILRVYTEAKQTEKLKAKTILNRLPRILSIAYRGIESGSEEWAEASKELFDIVLVHRKKLARKTPSNVMSKLWEAHKKSTHENRWHDGTLKIICSIVKKVALEKICNDIVLGLRYAVETRNMSQFKKYNHFLCQIMQARIAPGPRAEVRCLALQKCFSLISTCSTTWEEKEDILQSSLVILGSYRALIGSQTVFLCPFELSLCLEAIIRAPFKICDTVPEFFSIFLPSFKILHGFLTKHEEIAADRMPSVLRCFSILLSATIYRFHQGKNLTDTELKSGIICAEKLGNIGEVMADQKLRFRRVAPYIIAEMLEHFQKFTLYPLIREQLAHGVYGLMSILDKPAVSQLLVTLSSGPREVFKMEYETYVKYRKYSGKV